MLNQCQQMLPAYQELIDVLFQCRKGASHQHAPGRDRPREITGERHGRLRREWRVALDTTPGYSHCFITIVWPTCRLDDIGSRWTGIGCVLHCAK